MARSKLPRGFSVCVMTQHGSCNFDGIAQYGQISNNNTRKFGCWVDEGPTRSQFMLYLQLASDADIQIARDMFAYWKKCKLIPPSVKCTQWTDIAYPTFRKLIASCRCVCPYHEPAASKRTLTDVKATASQPSQAKVSRSYVFAPGMHGGLRCACCRRHTSFHNACCIYDVVSLGALREILCNLFGGEGIPVFCSFCKDLVLEASSKAQSLCVDGAWEPRAKALLNTAQAFANRDAHGTAVDADGCFYPGVQFGKTCRWEPHRGRTSRDPFFVPPRLRE